MRTLSPTSLKLILHSLREADGDSLEDCLRREYRIVCALATAPDFHEGVRARLVDKDGAPQWSPADLSAVDIEPYLKEPAVGDLDFD